MCFFEHELLNMQSIVEFLKLIHEVLTSGNKVRLSVYVFLLVLNRDVSSWRNGLRTLFESRCERHKSEFDTRVALVFMVIYIKHINLISTQPWVLMSSAQIWYSTIDSNRNFNSSAFNFYEVWVYSTYSSVSSFF